MSGQIGSPTSLALTWNSYTNLDHHSYKCAAYGIDEKGRAVSVSTTAKADWESDAVSAELHALATQIELVTSSSQENAKSLRSKIDTLGDATDEKMTSLLSQIETLGDATDEKMTSLLSKIETLGDATDEKMTSLLSQIETLNSKIDAIYRSSRVQSVLLYADQIKFDISDVYKDTVYLASKHEEPFNIKRANNACVAARGYLVELVDDEEYNFVFDFVKRVGGSKSFMTGGNDMAHEGKFFYFNSGKPVPASLTWASGNPDNANNAEDCMEFLIGRGLNDRPCQSRSKFVCEVPLPSQ